MEGEKVPPFLPKMTAHRRRGGTRACDGRGDKYANRITGISLAKTLVFKKAALSSQVCAPKFIDEEFRLSTFDRSGYGQL